VSTVLFHGQNVTGQVRVLTDLHIYTGFILTKLMTNTSGCCYSL